MVWLQPRANIKALRLLEQQNTAREGGKAHCVLQGEGRNKNGPCWGVREGVKTAGARSQAGVGPVWLWGLFLTGGRTSKVSLGRAGGRGERKCLSRWSGSVSFWAMRAPLNIFPNVYVSALFSVLETERAEMARHTPS